VGTPRRARRPPDSQAHAVAGPVRQRARERGPVRVWVGGAIVVGRIERLARRLPVGLGSAVRIDGPGLRGAVRTGVVGPGLRGTVRRRLASPVLTQGR